MEFMLCDDCGNQGSVKPERCSTCKQAVHVYKNPVGDVLKGTIPLLRKLGREQLDSVLPAENDKAADDDDEEDELECAECIKGYGSRDVISVNVMNCLFCNWKVQTFYEFAQKAKCTNCQNFRTRLGPHNAENEQWCNSCSQVRPELWTQNKTEQCRECWKSALKGKKVVLPAPGDVDGAPARIVDESTTFQYDCLFCGVKDQLWTDLGDSTSQCTGCKVTGTNSGWETCPTCNQQDYIYILNSLRQCFTCWNVGDGDPDVEAEKVEQQSQQILS